MLVAAAATAQDYVYVRVYCRLGTILSYTRMWTCTETQQKHIANDVVKTHHSHRTSARSHCNNITKTSLAAPSRFAECATCVTHMCMHASQNAWRSFVFSYTCSPCEWLVGAMEHMRCHTEQCDRTMHTRCNIRANSLQASRVALVAFWRAVEGRFWVWHMWRFVVVHQSCCDARWVRDKC